MMLEPILQRVRARMEERAAKRSLRDLERACAGMPAPRGFARAVAAAPHGLGLIAELKKASPSAGVIRADFDVQELAAGYAEGGASALSVLTEADHFQGSLANLERAHEIGLPCLQKDFLQTEYQVLEARAHGADAVLLISEALEPATLRDLTRLALDLEMDVLVESHSAPLWRRAATLAERDHERVLVGINNRDLRTFQVSLEASFAALAELPHELLIVAESGIRTGEDLVALRKAGARGVLVGETLLRAKNVEVAVRELLEPLGG